MKKREHNSAHQGEFQKSSKSLVIAPKVQKRLPGTFSPSCQDWTEARHHHAPDDNRALRSCTVFFIPVT
jgi:hypothetical protein